MSGAPGWRTHEVRVLREHYPTGGVAACAPLLPGRSALAIINQARRLGVPPPALPRDPARGRSRITPAIRAEMIRLAARPVSWSQVRALAQKWGVTPQTAAARLRRCGGQLRVRPRWTREQDALLRAHCDLRPERIARLLRALGVQRTPKAVYVRMHALGLTGRIDDGGYSANELSRLLGISNTTVRAHIATGQLPARRRPLIDPDPTVSPVTWLIEPRDVRRWLRADPRRLARVRRRADRLWLADLLGEVGHAPASQPRRPRPDYSGIPEHHLAAPGAPA